MCLSYARTHSDWKKRDSIANVKWNELGKAISKSPALIWNYTGWILIKHVIDNTDDELEQIMHTEWISQVNEEGMSL